MGSLMLARGLFNIPNDCLQGKSAERACRGFLAYHSHITDANTFMRYC